MQLDVEYSQAMTPDPKTILEGTGAEVSEYAKAHPKERFRLVAVPRKAGQQGRPESRIEEALEVIEALRDKIPVLPPRAFSTDSLYE